MNVKKSPTGSLLVELENQSEIDGLWAVAAHVGGGSETLRPLFSKVCHEDQGLFEQLRPYTTPMFDECDGQQIALPPEPATLLAEHYGLCVSGSVQFHLPRGKRKEGEKSSCV